MTQEDFAREIFHWFLEEDKRANNYMNYRDELDLTTVFLDGEFDLIALAKYLLDQHDLRSE